MSGNPKKKHSKKENAGELQSSSAEAVSQQIQQVYDNIIGNATLASPIRVEFFENIKLTLALKVI